MTGDLTERAQAVVADVLGPIAAIGDVRPVDDGRGVFSHVVRVELDGADVPSVAVKLVKDDANGAAAISNGAVDRELLAYRRLLPACPDVGAPSCHGTSAIDPLGPAFVLDDLSQHRFTDQVQGLSDADARAIATELGRLHTAFADPARLADLDLRRSTPSTLPAAAIDAGAATLADRWPELSPERTAALVRLASLRAEAVEAFTAECHGASTVCHGDPRADNVAFAADGRAVLFDWQQIAVQFGEADLAWLMATSLTTDTRRALEADVIASYAMVRNQDAASTWRRYVIGATLPGLAVLLLAQRSIDDDRTRRFVRVSLERIADAVTDLDVVRSISS